MSEPLNLRVGGVYLNRKGERVEIVHDDGALHSDHEAYQFRGNGGHFYTLRGRWGTSDEDTPFDLVSEVTEARGHSPYSVDQLRRLIDMTWGFVHEDESVPSIRIQDRLIAKLDEESRVAAFMTAPDATDTRKIDNILQFYKGWTDTSEVCLSLKDLRAFRAGYDVERQRVSALVADCHRFDMLRVNSWTLRCFNIQTGGGDCDIGWRVIEHHMAQPHERVVAEVYEDDPRKAIDKALVERADRKIFHHPV